MKVCMVSSPITGGLKDGIGSHVLALSKHISRMGCEVHIICFHPTRKDFVVNGIFVHQVRVFQYGSRFALYPQLLLRIASEINHLNKRYNFDIVHGHGGYAVGAALPRLLNNVSTFIATIHGVSYDEFYRRITEVGQFKKELPESAVLIRALTASLYLPFAKILGTLTYNLADLNIATCNFVAKEASQKYHIPHSKIRIMPHSIDAQRFSTIGDQFFRKTLDLKNKKVVLYVGQLIARKGLITLLEAFSIVRRNIPNAVLLCVGKGYMKQVFKLLARRLNIEESVLMHDQFISEEVFPQLYPVGNVFVIPSIYEQGISTSLLEAMSSRRAVVTTNIGAFPEIISNGFNGLLVEKSNAVQLADRIMLLLNDEEYSKNLGERARETVLSRFDWATNARKIVKIYEKLVS